MSGELVGKSTFASMRDNAESALGGVLPLRGRHEELAAGLARGIVYALLYVGDELRAQRTGREVPGDVG